MGEFRAHISIKRSLALHAQPTSQGMMDYKVFGLELARWSGFKASDWFYRFDSYDIADYDMPMSCFAWLVMGQDTAVLVDCGVDPASAAARNLSIDRSLTDLLAVFGQRPEDIDHVVLSHLHFDHTGNIDLFPRATFSLDRRELNFWTGPFGTQPALAAPVESREIEQILHLERQGRLILTDDEHEVHPGIITRRTGGHTPGQTMTTVRTPDHRIVLAGDALHYYEEIRQNRLYKVFTNAEEMLETYATLRELDARSDTTVIAGHDPQVMSEFASVADGCVDVTSPLQGPADHPSPRRSATTHTP